ncbi:hypothetical protein [Bradyrhizobium ottawaense]|uniref:hypothetical protein n=1 Tax=Bradyrhizobium ottawaense TaxID=931866 RepID=UPI001BACE4DD|nr:hypothetical protein [Bradyrhizobium ottawaense]MBR1362925.1 hypothetical protein [Bradyrhizobium ottawaense]
MSLAEKKPLQILVQFVASRAPSRRLDHDFPPISLDVLPKQGVGVLDGLIDLRRHAAIPAVESHSRAASTGMNKRPPRFTIRGFASSESE